MSGGSSVLDKIVTGFTKAVLDPILFVLAAVALLVFLWGMAQFIMKASSPEGRSTGVRHMAYGIIGLFIIVSTWGIVNLIQKVTKDLLG